MKGCLFNTFRHFSFGFCCVMWMAEYVNEHWCLVVASLTEHCVCLGVVSDWVLYCRLLCRWCSLFTSTKTRRRHRVESSSRSCFKSCVSSWVWPSSIHGSKTSNCSCFFCTVTPVELSIKNLAPRTPSQLSRGTKFSDSSGGAYPENFISDWTNRRLNK